MSGTALDHRLVRDYLRELDAAMRGVPAAQAGELREQITAHLEDALRPGAGDQEVAAALRRLGPPADLAVEAGAAPGSPGLRSALRSARTRRRLAAAIAVPAAIAVVLSAVQISRDVNNEASSGRGQHLAVLDAAVVTLTQDLEDERDLSAGFAARGQAGPVPVTLAHARAATDAAASTVRADAAGLGAGYPPGPVQTLPGLLAVLSELNDVRAAVSRSATPAAQVIRLYTSSLIAPANTFSAAIGDAAGHAGVPDTAIALAALLRAENDRSVQRAILYAALSAQPPVLTRKNLDSLQQADTQVVADLTAFNTAAAPAEWRLFTDTVAGAAVDRADAEENLAEAYASPTAPLTRTAGLHAATWYGDMSTTIADMRMVADQLASQITGQADTMKSNTTRSLLLTSLATLALLLVLLTAAVLVIAGRRPG